MAESGWECHVPADQDMVIFTAKLTKKDASGMHPDRLELLKQAGQMINQAFAHPLDPTPSGEFRRASQAITAHYFPDDESTLPS